MVRWYTFSDLGEVGIDNGEIGEGHDIQYVMDWRMMMKADRYIERV